MYGSGQVPRSTQGVLYRQAAHTKCQSLPPDSLFSSSSYLWHGGYWQQTELLLLNLTTPWFFAHLSACFSHSNYNCQNDFPSCSSAHGNTLPDSITFCDQISTSTDSVSPENRVAAGKCKPCQKLEKESLLQVVKLLGTEKRSHIFLSLRTCSCRL